MVEMPDEEVQDAFSDAGSRNVWVRKAYLVLLVVLGIVAGITVIWYYNKHNTVCLCITGGLVGATVIIYPICPHKWRRHWAPALIFLLLFAILLGNFCGSIDSKLHGLDVLLGIASLAVFVALVIVYSLQTRCNFNIIVGIVLALAVFGLYWGIIHAVKKEAFEQGNVLLAGISGMILALWFSLDTQLIVSGLHYYDIAPNDMLFGAQNLATDYINFIVFIFRGLVRCCQR